MEVTAPRTSARSIQRSAALWVLRLGLVLAGILLLRSAFELHAEIVKQGRQEFRSLEALRSADALLTLALAAGAALLFTVACRLPLRSGVSWPPIILAAIPLLLVAHLPFLVDVEGSGPAPWYGRLEFFDGEMFRWVATAFVGVALGYGLGRRVHRS